MLAININEPFAELPTDVLKIIFVKCGWRDVRKPFHYVCKRWHIILENYKPWFYQQLIISSKIIHKHGFTFGFYSLPENEKQGCHIYKFYLHYVYSHWRDGKKHGLTSIDVVSGLQMRYNNGDLKEASNPMTQTFWNIAHGYPTIPTISPSVK